MSCAVIDASCISAVTLLIIEQDLSFVLGLADRFAVFKLGEVMDTGPIDAGSFAGSTNTCGCESYDADTDVVDQLSLSIDVGIAAGRGSDFWRRSRRGCPYCAPSFSGHTRGN
jgi:energy-coupling factor transporter ATP-binding protein EcfA2